MLKILKHLKSIFCRLWRRKRRCEHYKGCRKEATVRCHLIDYDKDPPKDIYEWLCVEHAKEAGYCYLCGEFFAGCEEFDFPEAYGHIPGLCPVCSDQVKTDCGEYDDESKYDYYELDYEDY